MPEIAVLFDGWPLAYEPNGPAAIHLHTLLDYLPENVQAHLAVPSEGKSYNLPKVITHVLPVSRSARGRVRWEQRELPALAKKQRIAVTHLVGGSPAVFGPQYCLVSPAGGQITDQMANLPGWLPARPQGLVVRWQQALAQGGLLRAGGLAWPDDLPLPNFARPIYPLCPAVPAVFCQEPTAQSISDLPSLPDSYVLYHGPTGELDLRRVLDAWTWAVAAIGEYYPLIVVGVDLATRDMLNRLCAEYQLSETIHALPEISLPALALVYQHSTALFHPTAESPWGGALRLGLACGKPVVALETRLSDALVGPAGYLVQPEESYPAYCRLLGAALVSVVVEESLAETLSQAARERAQPWKQAGAQFTGELSAIYNQFTYRS